MDQSRPQILDSTKGKGGGKTQKGTGGGKGTGDPLVITWDDLAKKLQTGLNACKTATSRLDTLTGKSLENMALKKFMDETMATVDEELDAMHSVFLSCVVIAVVVVVDVGVCVGVTVVVAALVVGIVIVTNDVWLPR